MTIKHWSILGPGFLVLIMAFSGALFLPIPFMRDQGIYAYVAWSWLGERYPYQFAFEHKGPWLYLVYAVFLKISQGAMWGVNLADLLARIATVILVWILGYKIFDEKRAFLSAFLVFIPLFSVFNSCWWNAQAESFMMPLILLSGIFAYQAIGSEKNLPKALFSFITGLVLSQYLMFKLSGFWLLLGLGVFLWVFSQPRKKILAGYALGLISGIVIWLFYFWIRGIGREFFEQVVLFNWFHLQGYRPPAMNLLSLFGRELLLIYGLGLVLFPAGIYQLFKTRKERSFGLVLCLFLASLLEIISQARFFLYHLLVMIPSSALVLSAGTEIKLKKFPKLWRWASIGIILIWAITAGRLYFWLQRHYQSLDYLRGKITQGEFYARFWEPKLNGRSDYNAYASWVVANYIRKETSKEDYVLIFGYEPGINYLSARRSPSRFHSHYPLSFEPETKLAHRLREQWRGEFFEELALHPPRLVVVVHNDITALEPKDSYQIAQEFTEFFNWLKLNYQPREKIEDFEFFWRREND